jgi:hypothetical protein
MTKGSVGLRQPKKHNILKQVYQKYKTWNTNMEPPKPNSLEMLNVAQSSIDKKPILSKEIGS